MSDHINKLCEKNYNNITDLYDVLLKINILFPQNDFILIYNIVRGITAAYNITRDNIMTAAYMRESEDTQEHAMNILKQKVEKLENEIERLNNVIILPKQIAHLEEEYTARMVIISEEKTDNVEINKYHKKLGYFLSEQKKREQMLRDLIKEQLLKNITPTSSDLYQYKIKYK
jgi:hypothetical protein